MTSITTTQVPLPYLCIENSISKWLPLLFNPSTNSLLREWIILYLHSIVFIHDIDPIRKSESNLASYVSLLLLDNSRYIRAASLAILGRLMTPSFPIINRTLMNIALRTTIDGSSIVRYSLAHCIGRCVSFHGDSITDHF
jgi:hypothetical protein